MPLERVNRHMRAISSDQECSVSPQGEELGQVGQQAEFLVGFEVVAMTPHQGHQAAVFRPNRIDLSPAGQEVVVDEADHMEAVRHDDRLGEVLADDRAIDDGQVHADYAHLLFDFQGKKIRLQGGFGAAERNIVNAVVFQVAERCGIALLAGEEVLVDAQDLRAYRGMVLAGAALEVAQEVALHGGGADALAAAQIPDRAEIGAELYLEHFGPVAVNPAAGIGRHVNLAVRVTIGQTKRGARAGSPTIGDRVWSGTNAVIVGSIRVGDGALIARERT
jgi:hypothetical protein